jgi:opacity protein-like surface antigen
MLASASAVARAVEPVMADSLHDCRRMSTSTLMRYLLCTAAVFALVPAAARAQQVPHAGQVAAGGEIGVYVPTDEPLSPGYTWGGLIEFYATPRIGIRGTVMTMSNEYDGRDDVEEDQTRFGVDFVYNWEFGRVHPFAGGGIGMHLLRLDREDADAGDEDNTEFSVQGLGGIEFFLNRAWTVKTEARYQWVGTPDKRGSIDPDGLSLTIGLKRYF